MGGTAWGAEYPYKEAVGTLAAVGRTPSRHLGDECDGLTFENMLSTEFLEPTDLSKSEVKGNPLPFLAADELALVADGAADGVSGVTDFFEPVFTSPLGSAAEFPGATPTFAAAEPEPSPIPAQELAPEEL